uniref:Nitrogen regulatory protein areA GATA-like domain-containing protein n=1 Tax=Mycena chlorophos TaxID=658473 RepID=A0ABQ0M1T8_MYCCL|nr:predicted protein [Mycena chlorophos]
MHEGNSPSLSFLAVAAPVQDATDVLRLLSVFSKCPDAVQEGHRLQNLAWRLAPSLKFRPAQPWPPTPESLSSDDDSKELASPRPRPTPGKVIYDIIPAKKLAPTKTGYATPGSSSSSCASSTVSIAVQATQDPDVAVPRLILVAPTPNLSPHPTPPATPQLPAASPARMPSPISLAPPPDPNPAVSSRSATRGVPPASAVTVLSSPAMTPASTTYPHLNPAPQHSQYPPQAQSTHILPLGGGRLTTKPTFFLHAGRSNSSPSSSPSHSSQRSSNSSSSDSSQERERERREEEIRAREREMAQRQAYAGDARGRVRTTPPRSEASDLAQMAAKMQAPPAQPTNPPLNTKARKLGLSTRTVSTPFLAAQAASRPLADLEDSRSVSSHATSSSNAKIRNARAKQPRASTSRPGHPRAGSSRSRSRISKGSNSKNGAANDLGLPSNLAAAVAFVEQGKRRTTVVLATSDEDSEWSDDEDDNQDKDDGAEEDEEQDWEDESASPSQPQNPPPSLQQRPNGPSELRHLPTRPTHRSAGHLPSLAKPQQQRGHQRHSSERSIPSDPQPEPNLFAKMPRVSYENLPQLAKRGPSGLTLLLSGRFAEAPAMPRQRQRPVGGFGGLGLAMTTGPPTSGAQLSPVPPTPATALDRPAPQRKASAPLPSRPNNVPRVKSTTALPPLNGSLGKSPAANPVVTTPTSRTGYRPKGPPAEAEFTDDDESDADGRGKGKDRASDDGLQLSKSAAHEKLRILAERSDISRAKNGSGSSTDIPEERRRQYEAAGVPEWVPANSSSRPLEPEEPPQVSAVAQPSAPVQYPYYLPPPMPPSSPKTTRTRMLRNELSESLRHNLVWLRRQTKAEFTGPTPRRTKSTANVPAERNLVRLTPRDPSDPEYVDPLLDQQQQPTREAPRLVRNFSYDNSDFHRSGW